MLFLLVFILIPVSLSYFYSLGLSAQIIWSSFRGVSQLILIGFLLTYLFSLEPIYGIPLMLISMIFIASYHASKRGRGLSLIFPIVFCVITAIEVFVLIVWLGFNMIAFVPESVIPMSGMVIGNSMIAIGLALERMKSEFKEGREKILAALSLGAKPDQAAQLFIKKIVKAAMIPNVDGLKTIGLVQLPGMMTGLILGGVAPVEAIRYQIVISLSIFASVSLSAMLITVIFYRFFFNKNQQLIKFDEH